MAINSNSEGMITAALNSCCGIIVTDKNGRIVSINELAKKIIDANDSEVLGEDINYVSPTINLQEVFKHGRSEKDKFFVKDEPHLLIKYPVIEKNRVLGVVVLILNIVEIESKLSTSIDQNLKMVVDSIYDGVIVTDGLGYILQVNKAYEYIAGIHENEYLGKHVCDIVNEGHVSNSVVEKIIKTRKPESMVQRLKIGKELLNSGTPIFDEVGKLYRVVTVLRDMSELENIKSRLFTLEAEKNLYQDELKKIKEKSKNNLVIYSPKMKDVFALAKRVANVDTTVLITGESGVGKEIVARYIHENSPRRKAAFVKINSGAIPENLIESELFGYVGGAFTGSRKTGGEGLLDAAQAGSFLFDEISELPLNLQVKLLRVLQEREFYRVGGNKAISTDIRFIAASNKNLHEMITQKKFREDLFYRLNVVTINIPPLRERKDDIPPLVMVFLKMYNEKYHQQKRISKEAIELLCECNWPGNIREVQNVIERLVVTYPEDLIERDALLNFGLKERDNYAVRPNEGNGLKETLEAIEKDMVWKAYEKAGCTRNAAALLRVTQSAVVKKMKKYGLKCRK